MNPQNLLPAARTIFKFAELSDRAKRRALEKRGEWACHDNWWASIYEDAARIGLKITGFDLDRSKHAAGEFIGDEYGLKVGRAIMREHGAECPTFKTAVAFMAHAVLMEACADPEGDWAEEFSAIEQSEQFLKDLLENYADMLQAECDYLTSADYLTERIMEDDPDFDEDGTEI